MSEPEDLAVRLEHAQAEVCRLRTRVRFLESWAVHTLAEHEQENAVLARLAMRGTIERFEEMTGDQGDEER